jgi:hypothetical protein
MGYKGVRSAIPNLPHSLSPAHWIIKLAAWSERRSSHSLRILNPRIWSSWARRGQNNCRENSLFRGPDMARHKTWSYHLRRFEESHGSVLHKISWFSWSPCGQLRGLEAPGPKQQSRQGRAGSWPCCAGAIEVLRSTLQMAQSSQPSGP